MKILKHDVNSEGKNLYSIEILGKKFDDIELKKFCSTKTSKPKHCLKCMDYGVVRFFDCPHRLNIVIKFYNMFTSIIIFFITRLLLSTPKLNLSRSLSFLIISFAVLDIICTTLETAIPKIRDKRFYNKLKKAEKNKIAKENAERQKLEAQKELEETNKAIQNPNYKNVLDAEKSVKALEKLCNDYDFGCNKEKLNICVKKLFMIIDVLKEDCSGYGRVAYLFDSSLPEFYNSLVLYSNYIKAECIEEDLEIMVSNSIEKFLNFLKKQKVQAIMDKPSVEAQLKSTLTTLNQIISEGE